MRAGLLTEHIDLLEPLTIRTETGSEDTIYEVKYKTRARVTYGSGNRENENGDIFYSHIVSFEVRRFYEFDENFRISWRKRQYRIVCIEPQIHNQSILVRTELIND